MFSTAGPGETRQDPEPACFSTARWFFFTARVQKEGIKVEAAHWADGQTGGEPPDEAAVKWLLDDGGSGRARRRHNDGQDAARGGGLHFRHHLSGVICL